MQALKTTCHGARSLVWALVLSYLALSAASATELRAPRRLSFGETLRCSLLLTKPKIGKATFKTKTFDVRVAGRSVRRSTFHPIRLEEEAQNQIGSYIEQLQAMGIPTRAYIQVLVGAHPEAMGTMTFGTKFLFFDKTITTPFDTPNVSLAVMLNATPGIFGGLSMFLGTFDSGSFAAPPRILRLPAITAEHHSLDSRFIVAHEVAHVSQPSMMGRGYKGHRSTIWEEARADILAYLMTGETDVVMPQGIQFEVPDGNGKTKVMSGGMARSLVSPRLTKVSDALPDLKQYHQNSQVISSLLFALSKRVSPDEVVEFIKWMDAIEKDPIPTLIDIEMKKRFEEPPQATVFVDPQNSEEVRAAVTANLHLIGDYFKVWMSSRKYSTETTDWINAELAQREL